MIYDPKVWGPHYWFVLFTMAVTYPTTVTDTIKKRYYNFIQDLPLFLPDEKSSKSFSEMIVNYPVTPYLDDRESMIKWVHFIHNRHNVMLGKKSITLERALKEYNLHYQSTFDYYNNYRIQYNNIIFAVTLVIILAISIKLYT